MMIKDRGRTNIYCYAWYIHFIDLIPPDVVGVVTSVASEVISLLLVRILQIWIRYIQYATTGTTLCHPQNWLCQCDALFCSWHLALISPLDHFNGDNARLSPNHQTHKTQGDSKVYFLQRQTRLSLNYSEHNLSHVQRYALLSQLSYNSISSLHSLTTFPTRLATQTQTKFSLLQIKTIPKNISTIGILLLLPSFITLQT